MHRGRCCESSSCCFHPLCLLSAAEIWMKWYILCSFFQWQSKKIHSRQKTLWCFLRIFYTSAMKYCFSKCLDTLYCQVVCTFPVAKQKKQWEDLSGKITHYLPHITFTSPKFCQRLTSNAECSVRYKLDSCSKPYRLFSLFGNSRHSKIHHCLNNNS